MMQRFLSTLVIAALALLGPNACLVQPGGPPGELLSGGFAPKIDSSKLIYVIPVEGIDTAARLVLADAIAAALQDAGKPAILAVKANKMGPTVAGRIVAIEERDSVFWVTAVWELRAPYGTAVAEFRQQVVVDKGLWQEGTAEAINLLVFDAGPSVVDMVRDYVSPMTTADTVPETEMSALVMPAPEEAAVAEAIPETDSEPSSRTGPIIALESPPRKPSRESHADTQYRIQSQPRPPAKAPAFTALEKRLIEAAKPKPGPRSVALNKAPTPVAVPQPAPAAGKVEKPRALIRKPPKKAKPKPILMPVPEALPSRVPKPAAVKKVKTKPILMPVPDANPTPITNPPPVAWGRPSFIIKTVQGAPGDGNRALTAAIKDALRKRDLTVTEDPRQAGFVISGRVSMGSVVNGRQQAKIVWSVDTINGQEVGKAVQENAVKAGSLNGSWGRVAKIVSNAAVVGIQELFGIDEKQSSNAAGVFGKSPEFPNITGLKRVPGRALPPP